MVTIIFINTCKTCFTVSPHATFKNGKKSHILRSHFASQVKIRHEKSPFFVLNTTKWAHNVQNTISTLCECTF